MSGAAGAAGVGGGVGRRAKGALASLPYALFDAPSFNGSVWVNSGSSGINLPKIGGPTLVASDPNWNGAPSILMDGVDDGFVASLTSQFSFLLDSTVPHTLLMWYRSTAVAGTTSKTFLSYGQSGFNGGYLFTLNQTYSGTASLNRIQGTFKEKFGTPGNIDNFVTLVGPIAESLSPPAPPQVIPKEGAVQSNMTLATSSSTQAKKHVVVHRMHRGGGSPEHVLITDGVVRSSSDCGIIGIPGLAGSTAVDENFDGIDGGAYSFNYFIYSVGRNSVLYNWDDELIGSGEGVEMGDLFTPSAPTPFGPLHLGCRPSGAGYLFWGGTIQHLVIDNRRWSDQEIADYCAARAAIVGAMGV